MPCDTLRINVKSPTPEKGTFFFYLYINLDVHQLAYGVLYTFPNTLTLKYL